MLATDGGKAESGVKSNEIFSRKTTTGFGTDILVFLFSVFSVFWGGFSFCAPFSKMLGATLGSGGGAPYAFSSFLLIPALHFIVSGVSVPENYRTD